MVLENKLKIETSNELAKVEERITKKKALELFDNKILDTLDEGTYETLATIHKYLFDEIYDFAGEMRDVNIAKSNFRFTPMIYLGDALKRIDAMPHRNIDEIIEKYVEMNIAHPFREGNGRSMRIWLDLILKKQLSKVVDWNLIDKDVYLMAMERSPVKDIEIKSIIKNALTDLIDDRGVYMKGIDNSYFYEGYDAYRVEDL